MITLYHITNRANVPSILHRGLVPQMGSNSQLCREMKSCIYLSDKESIPYWLVLLGISNPVILRVQLPRYPRAIKYSRYKEYRAYGLINPSQVGVLPVSTYGNLNAATQDLCRDFVFDLGYICVRLIRHYEYNRVNDIDAKSIMTQLYIANRLDFNCYSQSEWCTYLKKLGENGEYTFCDKYAIGTVNPPLWAKILTYPDDELTGIRMQIANFIQTRFYDCLNIDTGGWTG